MMAIVMPRLRMRVFERFCSCSRASLFSVSLVSICLATSLKVVDELLTCSLSLAMDWSDFSALAMIDFDDCSNAVEHSVNVLSALATDLSTLSMAAMTFSSLAVEALRC